MLQMVDCIVQSAVVCIEETGLMFVTLFVELIIIVAAVVGNLAVVEYDFV